MVSTCKQLPCPGLGSNGGRCVNSDTIPSRNFLMVQCAKLQILVDLGEQVIQQETKKKLCRQ